MKTKLIFTLFLFLCFSCGTNNTPTDTQKEKIKGEIKEVVNPIFKAIEELDVPNISKHCLDSPDFTMTLGGNLLSFKDFQSISEFFKPIINQKITIKDEKFYFIDSKNVLYSATINCRVNYKEGYSVDENPWATQFLFKQIDGKWMVINMTENGVERLVRNVESVKGLNQTELIKQYVGKWMQVPRNDSSLISYTKSNGYGLDINFRLTAKGKEYLKGRQSANYSKNLDKFIFIEVVDRYASSMLSWFISEKKSIAVPIRFMNNPSGANYKFEDEFISPTEFVSKKIVNNKVVEISTYKRVDSK